MATAPIPNEIVVTEIGEDESRALEELTRHECAEWLHRLRWDYSLGAELIQQVAHEHQLKGFVGWYDGKPAGYCFWVREGRKLLIGDVYVAPLYRDTLVAHAMAGMLLGRIETRPRVERIESQNISFVTDQVASLFRSYGYKKFDRYYMTRELDTTWRSEIGPLAPSVHILHGRPFLVRPMEDQDFQRAADLIADSYIGRPDSFINSQYRTQSGCREFLLNLMTSNGCGRYLPGSSLVVVPEGSREIVGVVVTSEIAERRGHFPQISTATEFQGIGIGRTMVETAFRQLEASGFLSVSLAVTALNENAVRLYENLSFHRDLTFSTFVKDVR